MLRGMASGLVVLACVLGGLGGCGGGAGRGPSGDAADGYAADEASVDGAVADAGATDDRPADPGGATDVEDPGGGDAAGDATGDGTGDAPPAGDADAGGDPGVADGACGECLDGICQPECGETAATCPGDCVKCKDGRCEPGEGPETCPEDCCGGGCGDGVCRGFSCGEDPTGCPQDCGTACGDKTCDKGESPKSCPMDCAWQVCGNGICEATDGGAEACPSDCADTCGNCECEGSEDWLACPVDCGYCGDGVCSPCAGLGDEAKSCVPDCGPDSEVCNGFDDDGDGLTDEQDAAGCVKHYRDGDDDGWGVWTDARCLCGPSGEYRAGNGADCDDGNAAAHPGAAEACDGADNDCDGATDEEGASGCVPHYRDVDLDGFGSDAVAARCLCGPDAATSFVATNAGDCLDTDPDVHTGAVEACNGLDDDCDGTTDPEGAAGCKTHWADGDGDGFGASGALSRCLCAPEAGWTGLATGDCDDGDAAVSPGAAEDCATAGDDDCDGDDNDAGAVGCTAFYLDEDGDGWGLADPECRCRAKGLYRATKLLDCDDKAATVHPEGVEDCLTAADDDCNGSTDAIFAAHCTMFWPDPDGDGYGVGAGECRCAPTAERPATKDGDCAPADPAVHPGAVEDCATTADDDCNALTNEQDVKGCHLYYVDSDGDGYGKDPQCWCEPRLSYTATAGGDCDDADTTVYPYPHALCGKDADCDGSRADPGEACDTDGTTLWGGCSDCAATEFLVRASTDWAIGAAVAARPGGGFVVAWSEVAGPYREIRFQSIDASGEFLGTPLVAAGASEAVNPRVAVLTDGRIALGWTQRVGTTSSSAWIRLFQSDGTPYGGVFELTAGGGTHRSITDLDALPGGGFVAASWSTTAADGVVAYATFFDKSAKAFAGSPVRISATATSSILNVAAGVDAKGGVVAVWQGTVPSVAVGTNVLRGRRLTAAGAVDGDEFQVGQCASPVSGTVGVGNADVAVAPDGRFVAVWQYDCSGSRSVRAKRFDAAGAQAGTWFQISSPGDTRQVWRPVVSLDASGRMTAAWTEWSTTAPTQTLGILATSRAWDATSSDVFRANTLETPGNGVTIDYPGIAGFPDGRTVLVWGVQASVEIGSGVFAQRFAADGTRLYR